MTDYLNSILSLPSLSAKHSWRGGMILFGDNQGALPRFKLKSIKGLWSTPDSDDNRRQKFGQAGEYATPSRLGGKTAVYSGTLQANTLDELDYYANALKAAQYTDQQLSEGVMSIARDAARGGGHTYQYTARLVQAECDDEQTHTAWDRPSPWQRDFVVSFRLSDPRVYVTDAQVVTNSPAGVGGADLAANISNPGMYDGIPVIRLFGPWVQPRISRPGGLLAFGFTLAGGEWADVDFATRKIIKNDGTDLTAQRDIATSTWWDAGQEGVPGGWPGPTVTAFSGTAAAGHPGAGSSFRVTFYPAV